MNFVAPYFLIGTAAALLFGIVLLFGAVRARRARERFGEEKRMVALVTYDASKRRAWKGVLLVLATALAFVAAARPQYGKGQKLIPAMNVDVVIVLDYSKSMYAKDVQPSRIFRAKVEVASLVKRLRGARFGAVAFAGDSLTFPLTADGGAIAQFLRQLEPNDMPVGGTSIARALESARSLLHRDPKARDHKRFIILITDGEDLEGSPVGIARSIANDGTTIHVVQIGGRTPEPIPLIGENGEVLGWRTGADGKPLTTELTAKGERQLKAIADASEKEEGGKKVEGGKYIRAEKGSTGIDQIADVLQSQMKADYAEKVETVYADVFMYPLAAAILLLVAEALLTEAPRRLFIRRPPPVKSGPASSIVGGPSFSEGRALPASFIVGPGGVPIPLGRMLAAPRVLVSASEASVGDAREEGVRRG